VELSVVIPVYNERATLGRVLMEVATVLPSVSKEIIIVDDCSTDGTRQWLETNFPQPVIDAGGITSGDGERIEFLPVAPVAAPALRLKVAYHPSNRGKGGALQTGFGLATGDVVVIQDGDLEYDPQEWQAMLALIVDRKVADVVFGSRFFGSAHRSLYYHHYLANRLISVVFNVLYNQMLSDIEVCYKMMRREVLRSLKLSALDFGIEIEIASQIALARRWRIYEIGISYFGRTYAEGKKINWKDGFKAIFYLVWYRIKPIGTA
jgi:glycosyltransferase involved in cell wall biosynthesis